MHEAGHALAALLLLPGIVDVESASIVPDEKTLGRVSMMASNMLCGCVHSRAVHCAMPWPWKALSLATQILPHTQRKPGELSVRQLRHLVMVFMAGEAGEAVFPGVISTEVRTCTCARTGAARTARLFEHTRTTCVLGTVPCLPLCLDTTAGPREAEL